jgi:hypothetical protein
MTNRDDDIVWGARAIGEVANVSEKKSFYLLETGKIPAKKIGDQWVGSRKKIRQHLIGGTD